MIWEESLPPVVSEVLVYSRLQHWEDLGIGPTVQVDFPTILHVCHEARSVALEHVLIRLEWTKAVRDRFKKNGRNEAHSSDDAEGTSGQSSKNDDDSLGIGGDGQAGTEADTLGGRVHTGDSDTDDAAAEHDYTGGNAATSSPDAPDAVPKHAKEVCGEGDELDDMTEDTSDSGILEPHYYVVCRRFRPELDYIFIGKYGLVSFINNLLRDTSVLPQHLVFSYRVWKLLSHWPEVAEEVKHSEDCGNIKSISVFWDDLDPSGGRERYGNKQPRYRVSQHLALPSGFPTHPLGWQGVDMERIRD